ncbi:DUF7155 family protein [Mycolicibacterium sp. XJ870]
MTLISTRTRRIVAIGAFAVAAAAAPAFMSTLTPQAEVTAGPACLAWFGNKEDGKCLSYSNGAPAVGGIPPVSIGAPGSGSPGFSTGPLLPGTTINQSIG